MKLLVIVWCIGIALVLGVLLAPALRGALLIGCAVYFVAVGIWCVAATKELNANVQWMEERLSNVRYGTVTERNAPLV